MILLPVPFISQLVFGNGGANCGPACLAMTLAYRGVIAPTQGAMLYVADIVRDGVPNDVGQWSGTYTTLQQLVACAGWFDIECAWLRSWSAIRLSIEAGEPVVLLVDNRALDPRQYPRSPAFDANHFVLLAGIDDDAGTMMVNDPLSVYAWAPAPYTERSLVAAASLVGGPIAIALVPIVPAPPPVQGEDVGIIDELNGQVLALREELDRRTTERDEATTQLEAARETLAARDSTIGAYEVDVIPPLRARVEAAEDALRHVGTPVGPDVARADVVMTDGTVRRLEPVP